MFWTVFFSILIVAYIIGCLLAFGLIVSCWDDFKDLRAERYKYAVLGCLLSWFTIGMFAGVVWKNNNKEK